MHEARVALKTHQKKIRTDNVKSRNKEQRSPMFARQKNTNSQSLTVLIKQKQDQTNSQNG